MNGNVDRVLKHQTRHNQMNRVAKQNLILHVLCNPQNDTTPEEIERTDRKHSPCHSNAICGERNDGFPSIRVLLEGEAGRQ